MVETAMVNSINHNFLCLQRKSLVAKKSQRHLSPLAVSQTLTDHGYQENVNRKLLLRWTAAAIIAK